MGPMKKGVRNEDQQILRLQIRALHTVIHQPGERMRRTCVYMITGAAAYSFTEAFACIWI
jgi:hypothetical protein